MISIEAGKAVFYRKSTLREAGDKDNSVKKANPAKGNPWVCAHLESVCRIDRSVCQILAVAAIIVIAVVVIERHKFVEFS